MTADPPPALGANRAFYAALEARDAEAMAAVWSHAEDVSCIHPGWRRLDGWIEVSRSWQAIFASSRPWKVRAGSERSFVSGAIAVVLCIEMLEEAEEPGEPARMQATNVFRAEETGWRMIHHHASPMADAGGDAEDDTVN
jgi:ketosteroid isomerase-like protein